MSRWKTVLASTFIAAYVGALAWGIVAHALKVGLCGNTLSYFVVWDMFCGWSAWDSRTHILAEGVSGQYYDVREPWGEFHPFGHTARIHYDHTNHLLPKHISNVLKHSEHEEIQQVYVVEEVWPKQYNLPPNLYDHYFGRANDKQSYFHLRAVCMDDGEVLKSFPNWYTQQQLNNLYDNPRLQRQAGEASSLYSTLFVPNAARTNRGLGLNTN
ncbi:MAG: hypothetical protein R3C59_05475 [Planctomycetaceae bacterium]